MGPKEKARYIRIAASIALIGNFILAGIKIVMAKASSSMAVLGDGLDSASDVLISLVTIIISGIIARPGDKEHPWGHQRAETIATMALSFMIFYAGAELIIQSIKKIIESSYNQQISMLAIIASLTSIAGKSILALIQYMFSKKSCSDIIKANAKNMMSDTVMSLGILVGLIMSHLFNCPVLDPVLAALVGIWVIKNAVEIFMEQNLELMDGTADTNLYKKLFAAVNEVRGVTNPHNARIRKMAGMYDIDLDIECAPSMPLYEAHELSEEVEKAVRKEIPEVYTVTIHIEPLDSDNHQPEERFGLRPSNIE